MSASAAPRVDYGGLAALPGLLAAARRRRVLLLSGPGSRHVGCATALLDGFDWEVFSEARRHVPRELVATAGERLSAFAADAVVSIGGGSATGLGKALRLEHAFFFVAVPTTYAASELTDLYGITSEAGKRTGRDARVIPDVALYDVELTRDMPLQLSVTSLMNALAHPMSALSTGRLEPAGVERALSAAHEVYRALGGILSDARGLAARAAALKGTVLAGQVLRDFAVGVHHQLAHALGGRFDLDHAGLHSVLLPHSVAWLKEQVPELHDQIQTRLGDTRLPSTLFGFLEQAGAATSLAGLGLTAADFATFLEQQPAPHRALLEAAFRGQRP